MATTIISTTPESPDSPMTNPALDRITMFAPCILDRGRFSWVWIVPSCPYCHKSHDHYGGPLDGDPYLYIGRIFAARCDSTDRRRLAVEYPLLNLWYVLEPIQSQPLPTEPTHTRAVGEG